jgi:hypothetical protein
VNVAVGGINSVVADGIVTGALVGEASVTDSTIGTGIALEHEVMKAKRIGRVFFIEKFS